MKWPLLETPDENDDAGDPYPWETDSYQFATTIFPKLFL